MLTYPTKYYDGTAGRQLVDCPDCSWPMDPAFPHGPEGCAPTPPPRAARAVTGLDVIRRYAVDHQFLSINDLRPLMDQQAIAPSSRGRAFSAACEAGVIEAVGYQPSTSARTKRHPIQIYRSLKYRGAAHQEEEHTA